MRNPLDLFNPPAQLYKPTIQNCARCGIECENKWCSTKCRLRRFPHDQCLGCGNPFEGKKYAIYCSHKCEAKIRNVPGATHAVAGGKKAAEIQKQRRGQGKSGWYIKEMGVHQHRIVAEKMLGRPLLPNEIVHHKDHNKKNNDPLNLEVMDKADHARMHMKEYWEKRRANET